MLSTIRTDAMVNRINKIRCDKIIKAGKGYHVPYVQVNAQGIVVYYWTVKDIRQEYRKLFGG